MGMSDPVNAPFGSGLLVQVLHHGDICEASWAESGSSHGKCPRTVLDVVGGLLVGKLAICAFIGPAVTFLIYVNILKHFHN